jgi:hypothetical protein
MGQPVVSRIAHHAKRTPDRVALVELHRGRETDHDELAQRVRALAWSLQERYGLGQGDRITVLSRNDSRVFEVLCACANLGAIAVPLNWRLTPNELIGIVTDADPGVLIHESWTAPVTSEVAAGAGVPVQVQWSSETSDEDSYEALATAEVPPEGISDRLARMRSGRSFTRPVRPGSRRASRRPTAACWPARSAFWSRTGSEEARAASPFCQRSTSPDWTFSRGERSCLGRFTVVTYPTAQDGGAACLWPLQGSGGTGVSHGFSVTDPRNDSAGLPGEANPQVNPGAPSGTRTPNPLIKSQLLCQLS